MINGVNWTMDEEGNLWGYIRETDFTFCIRGKK